MSLPKNALYNNKISSSYSRNYMSNISCQNGPNYNSGETIIINIPCSANLLLSGADTVLKCTLNFSNPAQGTLANLDRGGIAGVIQRLRIFHGSTLLSDIDNYGNLVNMMTTLQQSTDSVAGKLGILQGTSNHTGESVLLAGTADGDISYEYSFPLMSILTMTNNYVPLFAMSGSPLRLEIQLVSSIPRFIASTAALGAHSTKSLLSDVEMCCNFMQISDSGMAIIRNASGGVVQWVVNDYRNYGYNGTLQTSETQLSVPIPAKFNSLRSLFWSFRQNYAGVAARYPNESCKFGLKEYSLRVGSQTMPTKPPNSTSQFFSELLRGIGCVSDVNHETNFNKIDYSTDIPAAYAAGVSSKSFYAAMDLESYSNCSSDSIYSGYNSSVDDIFFNPSFNAQANNPVNIRVDSYALFDSLILITDGVATVQY
jgi:hypothetical protein